MNRERAGSTNKRCRLMVKGTHALRPGWPCHGEEDLCKCHLHCPRHPASMGKPSGNCEVRCMALRY